MTPEQSKLLEEWHAAKTQLDAAKDSEMELRKQVSASFFPSPEKGTQRIDIGNGYSLKLVHKINHKLDGKEAVSNALHQISQVDNAGHFIAGRLVTWKPELAIKEYEMLDPKYKSIIDRVIETKPAAPSLEVEGPKGKGK